MKLFPWSNTPGFYTPLETIFLPRVCALRDRPYVVRYVLRHGNARYRFDGAVRIRSEDADDADIPQSIAVDGADIVAQEERCAWCRAKGIVHCRGGCEAWVCKGRTSRYWRKEYFHCRKSCGLESYLKPINATFYGSRSMPESHARPEQTMPRPQPAAPLNLVTSRIETPSANRPALTTGTGNAKVRALPVPSRKLLK